MFTSKLYKRHRCCSAKTRKLFKNIPQQLLCSQHTSWLNSDQIELHFHHFPLLDTIRFFIILGFDWNWNHSDGKIPHSQSVICAKRTSLACSAVTLTYCQYLSIFMSLHNLCRELLLFHPHRWWRFCKKLRERGEEVIFEVTVKGLTWWWRTGFHGQSSYFCTCCLPEHRCEEGSHTEPAEKQLGQN